MNTSVKNSSAAFGWVGIVAAVAFIVMWIACYQADSSWTWGVDALSNFGVSGTDAADYFNYGCVISGILLAIYGVGKAQSSNVKGYTVAGIMLALTGICVMAVGVFTNDVHNGDYHDFFAILASVFMFAGIIATAIQQYYDGLVIPVGIAMIFCLAIIMCTLVFNPEKYEVYSIVIALFWIIMDGALMVALCPKGGKQ